MEWNDHEGDAKSFPREKRGCSAAMSPSGLFRVRHFSPLCRFAHHFSADIQKNQSLFHSFSQCFLGDSDWGTDPVMVCIIPFQFDISRLLILTLEMVKYFKIQIFSYEPSCKVRRGETRRLGLIQQSDIQQFYVRKHYNNCGIYNCSADKTKKVLFI